ncbi:MAG: ArsC/Spx/MgsR family protein [Candidatus Zixiibacteriota bacterium]
MPQKRATFMTYGHDERCDEVRRFIEDAGIRLDIRDLSKNPLTMEELDHMFGHNPLSYFINPASSEYTSLGLDQKVPDRREMLKLMAEHPGLLRRPIVKNARLLTIGCNKEKIAEMLQISQNGEPDEENENDSRKSGKVTRRSLPVRK